MPRLASGSCVRDKFVDGRAPRFGAGDRAVGFAGPAHALRADLGVDGALREIWRGFARSYKSGDKQAALKQLEAGVSRGDILAQWKLGRMYADGDGVPQDDYKAFLLFSKIADARGDESRDSVHAGVVADAFVALGAYWLDGIPQSPVKANPAHAAKAFNYAATYYGHPEAQYQLARMLLDGATGRAEPRLALRWLNHAAEKGHVQAQAVLGRMLLLGEATQRQPQRGLMWLQIARENANKARDGWVLELHRKASRPRPTTSAGRPPHRPSATSGPPSAAEPETGLFRQILKVPLTGTWSEGFSRARSSRSIATETSRSAACGDRSRWSIRMPLFRCQAPA